MVSVMNDTNSAKLRNKGDDGMNNATNQIQADDVSVFYGDKQALFNVSLDIEQHAMTSLIGPSSCNQISFLVALTG